MSLDVDYPTMQHKALTQRLQELDVFITNVTADLGYNKGDYPVRVLISRKRKLEDELAFWQMQIDRGLLKAGDNIKAVYIGNDPNHRGEKEISGIIGGVAYLPKPGCRIIQFYFHKNIRDFGDYEVSILPPKLLETEISDHLNK